MQTKQHATKKKTTLIFKYKQDKQDILGTIFFVVVEGFLAENVQNLQFY